MKILCLSCVSELTLQVCGVMKALRVVLVGSLIPWTSCVLWLTCLMRVLSMWCVLLLTIGLMLADSSFGLLMVSLFTVLVSTVMIPLVTLVRMNSMCAVE